LVRRARVLGGYLDGPDGIRVRIAQQEYPYDIGLWQNVVQGMGTANVLSFSPKQPYEDTKLQMQILAWFWPFSASPTMFSAIHFETNGFEGMYKLFDRLQASLFMIIDPNVSWPPPDPDRMPRRARTFDPDNAFLHDEGRAHGLTEIEAFRLRQMEDLKRFQDHESTIRRRQTFHKRYEATSSDKDIKQFPDKDLTADEEGEEAWRNAEGDRLDDFGVDEEAEFYDDEDIPLAELMRRRKQGSGFDPKEANGPKPHLKS
jgi:palmitoyltransferase